MQKCMYCGAIIPVGKRECEKCGTVIGEVPTKSPERKCKRCGTVVPEWTTRCPKCREHVPKRATPTSSVRCPSCGTTVSGGRKYCPKCNAVVGAGNAAANKASKSNVNKCRKCGAALPPDAKFCNKCGLEVLNEPEHGLFGGNDSSGIELNVDSTVKPSYSVVSGWKNAEIYTLKHIEAEYVYGCFRKVTSKFRNCTTSLRNDGTILLNATFFDAQLVRTEKPGQCIYRFEFTRTRKSGILPTDFLAMKELYTSVAQMFLALDPNTTVKTERNEYTTTRTSLF